MNWQPIETAPKDGTEILIFPSIQIAHWVGEVDEYGERREAHSYWGTYWDDYWERITSAKKQPTHWMPLPKPPKEVE